MLNWFDAITMQGFVLMSDKQKKAGKILDDPNSSVLVETKKLEDFKCGNCSEPLLMHVYLKGDKHERIVECKHCGISFPLDKSKRSNGAKVNSSNSEDVKGNNKKDSGKKESMVERLVRSW